MSALPTGEQDTALLQELPAQPNADVMRVQSKTKSRKRLQTGKSTFTELAEENAQARRRRVHDVDEEQEKEKEEEEKEEKDERKRTTLVTSKNSLPNLRSCCSQIMRGHKHVLCSSRLRVLWAIRLRGNGTSAGSGVR